MFLTYATSASKQHRAFGEFLAENFSLTDPQVHQEYSVAKLCPGYGNKRHRFDYWIPSMNLVVEIHGKQHYEPVRFGGVRKETAKHNYVRRMFADDAKRVAVHKQGILYMYWKYDEEITLEAFNEKLRVAEQETTERVPEPEVKVETDFDRKIKEAQEQSKEYYKKLRRQKPKEEKDIFDTPLIRGSNRKNNFNF